MAGPRVRRRWRMESWSEIEWIWYDEQYSDVHKAEAKENK